MTRYAQNTTVSVEKSRLEIERLVSRYGATKFVSGWEETGAAILFEMQGRRVRFALPLPDRNDPEFTRDGRSNERHVSAVETERRYEKATRSKWRALLLVIKAKLEAVESDISTFETEFLAHIVIPGGKTFGEWAIPHIAEAYETGKKMPPLLGR